jgi:hypothetical protein
MFQPFHRLPMFGFACFGFLMIGVILAVAVWLAFKSGKNGTTKLGGAAGCMISLALVFIAGLAALSCTAIALVNAPNELIRHGPIRRIEAQWPRLHSEHGKDSDSKSEDSEETSEKEADSKQGLHIQIEMAGGDATEVSRWFREHTDGDMTVSVDTVKGADGPLTRIDIRLPITEDELRDIRRDFQRDLPNLNLPDGIRVELKGDDD